MKNLFLLYKFHSLARLEVEAFTKNVDIVSKMMEAHIQKIQKYYVNDNFFHLFRGRRKFIRTHDTHIMYEQDIWEGEIDERKVAKILSCFFTMLLNKNKYLSRTEGGGI
jgi:hypothetical protein